MRNHRVDRTQVMHGELTGRCRCGEVSWRSPGPVLWAGHCHCDSCRRATSAPFTSFFGVPRNSIEWDGNLSIATSSDGRVSRLFCPQCGTQMTCRSDQWPDEAHLYAATLDDPTLFEPQAHFHFSEKVPWVGPDDSLPKYPGSADTTVPLVD